MFKNLDVFRIANAMAAHAQSRQAVLAQNIANADTPGYRTRDIAPFASYFETPNSSSIARATRAKHLLDGIGNAQIDRSAEPSPNGNSVSLEEEMMKVTANQMDYQAATSLYSKTMGLFRIAIGR